MDSPKYSEEYFEKVVGLPAKGFVPGVDLPIKFASVTQCKKVWGERPSHGGYRIKACSDEKLMQRILDLYSKVYQSPTVTNSQLTTAFARGILAERKGCAINWARFAVGVYKRKKNKNIKHVEEGVSEDKKEAKTRTCESFSDDSGKNMDSEPIGTGLPRESDDVDSGLGGQSAPSILGEWDAHEGGENPQSYKASDSGHPNFGKMADTLEPKAKKFVDFSSFVETPTNKLVELTNCALEKMSGPGECSRTFSPQMVYGRDGKGGEQYTEVLRAQQRQQMQLSLVAMSSKLRGDEEKLLELQSEKTKLSSEIQECKKTLDDLRLESSIEEAKVCSFRSELDRLGQRLVDVTKNITIAETQIRSIHELDVGGSDVKRFARDEVDTLVAEKSKLLKDCNGFEIKISEQQKCCDETRQKISRCQAKLYGELGEFHSLDVKQDELMRTVECSKSFCMRLEGIQRHGTFAFYPAPVPHQVKECGEVTNVKLKPCPVCSMWYKCFDIIVASCMCTYHPMCLAAHIQSSYTCATATCLKEFAPDWCLSMGFKLKQSTLVHHKTREVHMDESGPKCQSEGKTETARLEDNIQTTPINKKSIDNAEGTSISERLNKKRRRLVKGLDESA